MKRATQRTKRRRLRYAVVGLGHIAQNAVLPAFAHAQRNSVLAALFSDDAEKRKALSKRYGAPAYAYDEYARQLRGEEIDAVYVAVPNSLHAPFTIDAARAGVHVLCEKPMAVTERECRKMIGACADHGVKLMIAYRLHFEAASLEALRLARSGELGELRSFDSVFSMQVREGNVRLRQELGGGTLYDIGIYCINAARALFGDEPLEVSAMSVGGRDRRFAEVDEMTSAVLRFPRQRLATFTCSFGASDNSSYRLVGTKGTLRVEPAFEYAEGLVHHLTRDGKTRVKPFARRDQFAAEIEYFSRCILENRRPEPSGEEGLIDVSIIRSLYGSAERGAAVRLPRFPAEPRPHPRQRIDRRPSRRAALVRAQAPSR
ncbi:MAG TPA: Gfo/Idh/MocA family oxidoreductase [Candidatus Polarisedimenticolaceae bacterium]|nr:Gfo/Idh/MocA family oxidoreductase [Candidatus Polarisedimenticolaceae bacterium]